jgi:hypothetical protein
MFHEANFGNRLISLGAMPARVLELVFGSPGGFAGVATSGGPAVSALILVL